LASRCCTCRYYPEWEINVSLQRTTMCHSSLRPGLAESSWPVDVLRAVPLSLCRAKTARLGACTVKVRRGCPEVSVVGWTGSGRDSWIPGSYHLSCN
jgi:hypothetical protein